MGVEALLATADGLDGIDAGTSLGGRVFRIGGEIDAGQFGIVINNDPAAADKIFIGTTGIVAGTDRAILADNGKVTAGDDVLIKGSNGDQIRLENVAIGDLTADNFII